MDKNIGKKLDGRYELLELIGVGGMADIYRARDIQEDRIVAVKILKTEFAGSDEFLRRFRNESKAIALLSHPNIVKIYDVGFTDKVQFIVMEYVDGITLTDYIEQQGVLKWRDAVHFTVQILRALQHAHDRGIVHRDIKSSNIMLLRDGTIKVMDFGIARFNRENNKTVSEKTIGSVHYISPEQARGDITDERSDIYSVGVALYEMLTGKKPFDGDTPVAIALKHMQSTPKKPTELNETIPEGLEQIVLRAMQKEPYQRYQTAGEMIKDLEDFKKNPSIIFDYKYNSTDGSTKYFDRPVPAAEQERARRKRPEPEDCDEPDDEDDDYDDDDDDEYAERRSPLIPILFAVGTAFIIATVFLVLTLVSTRLNKTESDFRDVLGIGDSSDVSVTDSNEFIMPNLVGLSWEDALTKYSSYLDLQAQQEWSTYTKDEIFDQDLAEGRKVKIGASVTVKVSMGIKQIEIQDLSNRTQDAAERQLKKDGFVVSRTFEENDEISKDYVIRTIPEAHEMAPQGSTVVLVVSLGAKDTPVYVPKLINMPVETALKRCEEYHLVPKVDYVPSEEEKGTVLEQDLEPNSIVDRETEINLKVSSGEIPEAEKNITITLPKKAEGEFEFRYYVDGVLDDEATEVRDIGLSASKTIKYTVKGKSGEMKQLAVKVMSVETGRSDTYIVVNVEFTDDKVTATEESKNSAVFTELLVDAPVTSDETSDTDTSETEESSDASSETSDTSDNSDVSEPDGEVSDPTGGIPVD